MAFMDAYIRRLEEELRQFKRDLEPLESGTMHIGRRPSGGQWTDMTADWISHLKKTIATYEGILARLLSDK